MVTVVTGGMAAPAAPVPGYECKLVAPGPAVASVYSRPPYTLITVLLSVSSHARAESAMRREVCVTDGSAATAAPAPGRHRPPGGPGAAGRLDRGRVDHRIAPVVGAHAIGEQLGAQAVAVAADRVHPQAVAHRQPRPAAALREPPAPAPVPARPPGGAAAGAGGPPTPRSNGRGGVTAGSPRPVEQGHGGGLLTRNVPGRRGDQPRPHAARPDPAPARAVGRPLAQ